MANIIERMREAFGTASQQSDSRGQQMAKPAEQKITDTLVFADDGEMPITDKYGDFYAVYTPFSWRNKNGKKQFGYLIKGRNDGRIYGLETDTGLSMPASSVKKMLYDIAYDKNSKGSFSVPVADGFQPYQPEIVQRFRIMPTGEEGKIYE